MSVPECKRIPVVCSWCKKIYKLVKWDVSAGRKIGVSHGICPECLEKIKTKESISKLKNLGR